MFCKYCGSQIKTGAKFCSKCGKPAVNINQAVNETSSQSPNKSLAKGTVLGGIYEILEIIGSGGSGVVYKAHHTRLQTDVVVKKIRSSIRNKVRIRQEADILKRLKHPYLPMVYDFIETEEGVYTVMDFIPGYTIEEIVKKSGKLPQKQVRKWAEQLGEALDYLHRQNPPIIHSDIKPANVMVTKEGNICLIDFNISLAIDSQEESAVGVSAGFSPPEQYRDPATYARVTKNFTLQKSLSVNAGISNVQINQTHDGDTEILNENELANTNNTNYSNIALPNYTQFIGKGVDMRSDIYSLGMTICYMLTGVDPVADFEANRVKLMSEVSISEGFLFILNKMIEISPKDRYQTGSEYLKAIRNCYKLDKRYKSMHRTEIMLNFSALLLLFFGILLIAGGFYKSYKDKAAEYYSLISEAELYINSCDYDSATKCIEKAEKLLPEKIDAYVHELHQLFDTGNFEECIIRGSELLDSSTFSVSDDFDNHLLAEIYYIIGNAYFEEDDYLNAKTFLESATQKDNENGLYFRDLAIICAKLDELDNAEKNLDKAMKCELSDDSIYLAQGELNVANGNIDKAIEYFKKTLKLTDDRQTTYRVVNLLADTYKSIGAEKIDDEIELLEKYHIQIDNGNNNIIKEYLADAYMRKAKTDTNSSDMYYEKALELFYEIKDSGVVTFLLDQNIAILLENMNDIAAAEEYLHDMENEYPDRYEIFKRLAFLEADKQQKLDNTKRDYHKMKEYYEKALDLYNKDTQDSEMQLLENLMDDLEEGGWF